MIHPEEDFVDAYGFGPNDLEGTERRRESARRAAVRRAMKGLHPTNLPVGYVVGPQDVAVPDPATAPLVREAIRRYEAGERDLLALLADMGAKGLRSKRGNPLRLASFRDMLENPFYRGIIDLHGVRYKGSHEPLTSSLR